MATVPMSESDKTFILGRCLFRLCGSEAELIREISTLLPVKKNCGSANTTPEVLAGSSIKRIDLDELAKANGYSLKLSSSYDRSLALVSIINAALQEHADCLWIDAATFLTSDRQLVLVAGRSGAGKTTLALALALAGKAKVLSEDITLIDTAGQVVPFISAFALRPGAGELISACFGVAPQPLHYGQWFYEPSIYWDEAVPARFKLAVVIGLPGRDKEWSLRLEPISIGKCTRLLLPISNALRLDGGIECLMSCLAGSNCYTLQGGRLDQRGETILELASS